VTHDRECPADRILDRIAELEARIAELEARRAVKSFAGGERQLYREG